MVNYLPQYFNIAGLCLSYNLFQSYNQLFFMVLEVILSFAELKTFYNGVEQVKPKYITI